MMSCTPFFWVWNWSVELPGGASVCSQLLFSAFGKDRRERMLGEGFLSDAIAYVLFFILMVCFLSFLPTTVLLFLSFLYFLSFFFSFFFFLWGDLSTLTRDWIWALSSESAESRHWTTGELPVLLYFWTYTFSLNVHICTYVSKFVIYFVMS